MTTFEEIPPKVNKSIGDLLKLEETLERLPEEEIKIEEGIKDMFLNENENENVNGNGSDNGNRSDNGSVNVNESDNDNESDNESDNENENDDCEYEVDISDLSSAESDSESDIDDSSDDDSEVLSIGDSIVSENEQEEFEYGEVFETLPCSTRGNRENFDEDIGGESIASASVLAAGLIGCSSNRNKSTLIIGLLFLGVVGLASYIIWNKIKAMKEEIKKLE